ncbi:hypothetical protein EG327_010771 [Venturia inaequalis]|uniref:Uncharacterized protein n=1 Tax=Venturia inaequalis TaxID=5025 RepID=A0A8H3UI49_VENIN|nr:hypothetical protein EG327_010771 [Venturia inaequalis]
MNPHWVPRKPASRSRPTHSPRPETPLSIVESFVTDDRVLHKCRVTPLCDWIYCYHYYAHNGDTYGWSLQALKTAATLITYAVDTMSQHIIDVEAALDEDIHEDEDDYQSTLSENTASDEDENEQAALIEQKREETEDDQCERERKELQFRQIFQLECSVQLLLASFEKGEAAVMIEDRIRECQRVLIMIVGTRENGECL